MAWQPRPVEALRPGPPAGLRVRGLRVRLAGRRATIATVAAGAGGWALAAGLLIGHALGL